MASSLPTQVGISLDLLLPSPLREPGLSAQSVAPRSAIYPGWLPAVPLTLPLFLFQTPGTTEESLRTLPGCQRELRQ